jgi:hypothetical protein
MSVLKNLPEMGAFQVLDFQLGNVQPVYDFVGPMPLTTQLSFSKRKDCLTVYFYAYLPIIMILLTHDDPRRLQIPTI